MSTHVGDIFFDAKIDRKQYDQGLKSLDNSASKAGSLIGKKMGMAIAGAVSAFGFSKLISATSQVGDNIDKMSQKLGMSAKAYQEWDYIMQRCGTSIDSMTVGMKTLATSAETSKDALKELGITEQEVANLSQEQLFNRVITALQGVEDTTHRTYLAGQLLGRGATDLGALLNMSAEDTDLLRQRLMLLGGVMSDTAVQNSARFKDALTDIKMAFKGVYNVIAETILPVLTNAINKYIIPALMKAIQVLRVFINALGSIFGGFKSAIGKIKSSATSTKDAIKNAFGKKSTKDVNNSANAMKNVGSATKGVGKNAKNAKKSVQALKRELLGFDQITKLTKQDTSTGTGGAGGVGGGGDIDLGALDDATESASLLADAVGVLQGITIPPALAEALNNLKNAFAGLWDLLSSGGKWVFENILKPLGEWLMNSALPVAIDLVANVIKTITSALGLLGDILEPLWTYILKPIIEKVGGDLVNKIKAISDVIGLFPNVLDKAKAGFDKFKTAWSNATSGLADKLAGIKDKWNSFKDNSAKLKLSVTEGIQKTIEKIKTAWTSIKDRTATFKMNLTESFKKTYNNLATKVNNARAKSAIVRALFPSSLPYLAQGGFVKRNTPQLAVIGDNKREGEIVAPESKMMEMARMASAESTAQTLAVLNQILSAVRSLDLDVTLDGESIKKNTVRRINQHTMATGRLELII